MDHPSGGDIGQDPDHPSWSRVEGTLMSAARAVRRAYDRSFAELGVNLTEASILAHLADAGPLTQIELARRIGTSRARIGVHIDSLETKGSVERRSDPTDRRVWLVTLTQSGTALWTRSAAIDRNLREQLRAGTTAAEIEVLDQVLTRIQDNVQAIDGPPASPARYSPDSIGGRTSHQQ